MPADRASRLLAWATVGAVFGLMTLGNIVSATGSGLACPDWPLCHGRLIPPFEPAVLLEYGHRLVALLASVLLVTTIVAVFRRAEGGPPRRMGIALLVLLGLQIALGGTTVLLKLPPLVSTAHLLNALLIFGGLVILASVLAGAPETAAPDRAASARVGRLARVGLWVLLAQLVLGGYVRHAGAGLACPDFPLCSGEVLPGHWLAVLHWVHRWVGVGLLGVFVPLALAGRRTGLSPLTSLLGGLAALQVALGIATVLLGLDAVLRGGHAAIGYALWGLLVWVGVRAGNWRTVLREAGARRPRLGEAVRVP